MKERTDWLTLAAEVLLAIAIAGLLIATSLPWIVGR